MADPHQLYPCYSAAGSLHALTIEALPAAIGDSGDHVARLPASLARRVMELQERRKRQNNGMELRSQQHQPVILRLRSLCHDGMDGLALAQPHYAKLFCPTVAQATATAAVVQSGPPSARRGKKRRLSAAAEEIIITGENKCLVDGFELVGATCKSVLHLCGYHNASISIARYGFADLVMVATHYKHTVDRFRRCAQQSPVACPATSSGHLRCKEFWKVNVCAISCQ